MCGRYFFDIDEKELKDIVDTVQENLYRDIKTGEIYPTNSMPIITLNEGKMSAVVASWGFPKWDGKGVVINARVESLAEKRIFKTIYNSNRCIVPASAYFEWKKTSEDSKLKNKYIINKPDSILYIAGLYNMFEDKHSNEQLSLFNKSINNTLQYTIITKEVNSHVSCVHDRMPLIFDREEM